jgi:hypothetical protein
MNTNDSTFFTFDTANDPHVNAFGIEQDHMKSCPKPEDVDIERVHIHEDREGFRQKVTQYRFAYDMGNGKMGPLAVCLEHPCFSGKDVHPMTHVPHHQFHGVYATASNMNQDLETRLMSMLNKIAEKCQIELKDHKFMTESTLVYSVKFDQWLPERFRSVDALTCMPVNGVVVQPKFVLQADSTWHCHCVLILACVA